METIDYKIIRETSVNDFYKMPYKIKCKGLIFKKEYNNYYSKKYSLDDIAHYGDICEIIEWEEPEEEQEMTAKEMFEELGYTKFEDAITISYHFGNLQVRFWKNTKHIELFGCATPDMNIENEEYFEDDYKLFVAINKQIEELGWNNVKD